MRRPNGREREVAVDSALVCSTVMTSSIPDASLTLLSSAIVSFLWLSSNLERHSLIGERYPRPEDMSWCCSRTNQGVREPSSVRRARAVQLRGRSIHRQLLLGLAAGCEWQIRREGQDRYVAARARAQAWSSIAETHSVFEPSQTSSTILLACSRRLGLPTP